nr:helix-turn-helix domain-containing protein [Chloroflexota bacterium]
RLVSARTTATTATSARVERPVVPVPRDGWVQVANAFIDERPLDNERLAHVILMSYAWDEEACHPYQEELAARLGVSVRTIKRRVGELRAAALVTVERGGGQDHPNVYHLHVRPVRDDDDVRFTTILHRVLDDATLSQGARRAYIVLCRRAGGNGWCPCSNAALGAAIGVKPRVVYDYVRELADAGYLRLTERQGRSNRYTVETPERRKRSAGPGAIPPLAVVPSSSPQADADTRWRAFYVALMRMEPTKRLGRRVRTLLADVGEATVLEAIEGAAEFAARIHARALTIGMIRVEVGKIRGEEGLPALDARPAVETVEIAPPSLDMEPAWRDTLNELRGELTPENYKRWLEPTTVEGFDGGLLRVGVSDRFDQQWLDKRLRGPIERALGRVAPGVRVAFEVREEALAPDEALRAPPVSSPSRASPAAGERLTIARCAHCHFAPCRCPRKERRARERAGGKTRP